MIFANPTACHWVAEAHALPIVVVIFNNERYGAVRNATLAMFAAGAAGRENGLGLAICRRAHPSNAMPKRMVRSRRAWNGPPTFPTLCVPPAMPP